MTKSLSLLFFILGAIIIFPIKSFANATDLNIQHFVYYDSPEECAVDVIILDIQEGLINGSEALLFNGMEVGNFSTLPSLSDYEVHDNIQFSSPSFATKLGLTLGVDYDVEISDQDCASLSENDLVTFKNSSGDVVSTLTLLQLTFRHAWAYNPTLEIYEDIDLANNSIRLSSLSGTYDIGSGPLFSAPFAGETNCSLSTHGKSMSGLNAFILLFASLLFLGLLRQRSKTA